jgi:hypothetical protein
MVWDAFRTKNGVSSLAEMRRCVARHRNDAVLLDERQDPVIGCRILTSPFFWPEQAWLPVPASFAPNIVTGRGYSTEDTDGMALWNAVADRMAMAAFPAPDQPRLGAPKLVQQVLGQDKFAKRIIADEQVAFRMVTREIAREYILIPSDRHRDPISLVKIHMRAPGLSRDESQRRLLGEHADLVLSRTAAHQYVRRYAQLHNIGSTQDDPEGSQIDAVSVLAFGLINDLEDFLVSEDCIAIDASETRLTGEGPEWWTAIHYGVINRLMPELASERASPPG